MLVLRRRKDESIIINDDIEITVIAISGETVKLGIAAPRHVTVHRKEVYLEIQEENEQAISFSIDLSDLLSLKNK